MNIFQDGDEFGIIWDPDLIPDPEMIFTPLDYASLADGAPQTVGNVNDQGIR